MVAIVLINGSMEAHLITMVHSILDLVILAIDFIWVRQMAVQPVLVHALQASG